MTGTAPERGNRKIVVDNASGDYPTLSQAVRENGWGSWVELILAPRSGGSAYGNNLSIRRAIAGGANYVLLLNSDTQVRPQALASLVTFLENQPDIAIAGPSVENAEGAERPIAIRFPSVVSELSAALGIGLVTRLLGKRTVEMRMSGGAQRVDGVSGAAMIDSRAGSRADGRTSTRATSFTSRRPTSASARRARASPRGISRQAGVMHVMGQSTDVVIEGWREPKRLPGYWFESRHSYLAASLGIGAAIVADLMVLMAYPVGYLKQTLLGRKRAMVPTTSETFGDTAFCAGAIAPWPRSGLVRPREAKLKSARRVLWDNIAGVCNGQGGPQVCTISSHLRLNGPGAKE